MGVKFVGLKGDDAVAVIALYPESKDDEESASLEADGDIETAPDAGEESTTKTTQEEDE